MLGGRAWMQDISFSLSLQILNETEEKKVFILRAAFRRNFICRYLGGNRLISPLARVLKLSCFGAENCIASLLSFLTGIFAGFHLTFPSEKKERDIIYEAYIIFTPTNSEEGNGSCWILSHQWKTFGKVFFSVLVGEFILTALHHYFFPFSLSLSPNPLMACCTLGHCEGERENTFHSYVHCLSFWYTKLSAYKRMVVVWPPRLIACGGRFKSFIAAAALDQIGL